MEGTGDTERLAAIVNGLPDWERPARIHLVRSPKPTLSSAFVRRPFDQPSRLPRSHLHVQLPCILIIHLLVY